jgi:hypothetical protein
MKINKILLSLFLIIVLSSLVSSVDIQMKDSLSSGETLTIEIAGTFIESLQPENIFFYRDSHIVIPLDFELQYIENKYYLYTQLIGKQAGNYSIVLKNIQYMKAGQISEDEIIKEFIITSDLADFTINPGFIITEGDFYIDVQNLQESEITINIGVGEIEEETDDGFLSFLFGSKTVEYESSIDVISGETKRIDFNLENITNESLKLVKLSTDNSEYEIPIKVLPSNEISEEDKEKSFRFEPNYMSVAMYVDDIKNRIIYLFNNGEANLENITLSVSDSLQPYLEISVVEIDELKANKSLKIELNFTSDEENKTIQGKIIAELEDELNTTLDINLSFVLAYIPLPEDNETIIDPGIVQTCEEISGQICSEGYNCLNETEPASDGLCCLGECVEEEEPSSVGKTIGWLLVFLLIAALFWFFKNKYLGTEKKKINFTKIAKGKKRK